MLSNELKIKIDELWKKFWSNGMADHMNALKHINYLIFMKKLEDYENDRIIVAKQNKKKYGSIFEGYENMRWSVWSNYPGEKMLSHVKNNVFPFLKNLKTASNFKLDLKDSNFEIASSVLLQDAIDAINDLKISDQNLDTQGDVYEYVVSKLETSGLNGGFRTPRHIIQMMINLVDPDVHQKICDPACGTGGFLINSYLHILKKYNSEESNKSERILGDDLTDVQSEFLINNQLFGFDFEKPMTQFSQMNMILHGFKQPNIEYENSVGKKFNHDEEYDIILANPPFSGSLNKSEKHEDFGIESNATELLFVELCYKKLHVGGQAAIIVPTNVLFGTSKSHQFIKNLLLEKSELDTIIYLPKGVFKPYAAVETAILFFTKGGETKNIWLYELRHDGFTLDDKRSPIKENDIPDLLKKFPNHETSENAINVSIEEIKENDNILNVRRYLDNSIPPKKYDIQKIINQIKELKNTEKKIEEKVTESLKEFGFKIKHD
jgi:type I restriction enzyme M protein